jgi:hypothetical protein
MGSQYGIREVEEGWVVSGKIDGQYVVVDPTVRTYEDVKRRRCEMNYEYYLPRVGHEFASAWMKSYQQAA